MPPNSSPPASLPPSPLATAADYADAMLTSRRAKNVFWSITAMMVVIQIALFIVARFKVDVTRPTAVTDLLKYSIGAIDFLGIVFPTLMSVVLLLTVGIMLNGRLLGVSRILSAFLWSIVLVMLLFPWQAFLANQNFTSSEFKIPGVLYNWTELVARARLRPDGARQFLLYWSRFIGWPIAALVIMAAIHVNARRGFRQALGELPPEPLMPQTPA